MEFNNVLKGYMLMNTNKKKMSQSVIMYIEIRLKSPSLANSPTAGKIFMEFEKLHY